MPKLFESIRDIENNQNLIRERSYGVIEFCDGNLVGIHFRPWPKIISTVEAKWIGGWQHNRKKKDHCLAYYNQPVGSPNYLALKYVVTTFGTRYKTLYRASIILDEIARIKGTDAIVAELTNPRITDRFLTRMGWEEHWHNRRGRHFIKRFYGDFPDQSRELTKICNESRL